MKVAVVGSGLSGLACASKLLKKGFNVHIFEKEKDIGGLAGYTSLSNGVFPKTYHHVLKSDETLNKSLTFYKIAIDWRTVNIGFYTGSKIFSFNTPIDLLRFKPLSVIDRLRLGWLVLNTQYNERLRDVTIKDWIISKSGSNVYEYFISPLITTYFGSSEDIAAAYLARRWSSESKHASNNLGYADFPKLIDSYVDEINLNGGLLKTHHLIKGVKVEKDKVAVLSQSKAHYDAIVLTCPTPESKTLLKGVSSDIINSLDKYEYRACLCLALRLEKKISEYYWVNILDRKTPFIACFEHGNLNPRLKGGLVYAVAYVHPTDSLWKMDDKTIYEEFKSGLKKVFKATPRVKSWKLFKTRYGTPVYKVGYRNMDINPYPQIYFAGVYMSFPEIRSSGPAIRTGVEAAEKLAKDFE